MLSANLFCVGSFFLILLYGLLLKQAGNVARNECRFEIRYCGSFSDKEIRVKSELNL